MAIRFHSRLYSGISRLMCEPCKMVDMAKGISLKEFLEHVNALELQEACTLAELTMEELQANNGVTFHVTSWTGEAVYFFTHRYAEYFLVK